MAPKEPLRRSSHLRRKRKRRIRSSLSLAKAARSPHVPKAHQDLGEQGKPRRRSPRSAAPAQPHRSGPTGPRLRRPVRREPLRVHRESRQSAKAPPRTSRTRQTSQRGSGIQPRPLRNPRRRQGGLLDSPQANQLPGHLRTLLGREPWHRQPQPSMKELVKHPHLALPLPRVAAPSMSRMVWLSRSAWRWRWRSRRRSSPLPTQWNPWRCLQGRRSGTRRRQLRAARSGIIPRSLLQSPTRESSEFVRSRKRSSSCCSMLECCTRPTVTASPWSSSRAASASTFLASEALRQLPLMRRSQTMLRATLTRAKKLPTSSSFTSGRRPKQLRRPRRLRSRPRPTPTRISSSFISSNSTNSSTTSTSSRPTQHSKPQHRRGMPRHLLQGRLLSMAHR
mmetsp:Transcript_26828/g.62273  ORF Transcript_26828/g.62273 Transcript_26828/m.62273 type:complete len:393 (+) Transcript_26828:348-1526(+)